MSLLVMGACKSESQDEVVVSRELVQIDSLGGYEDVLALGTFREAFDTIYKTTLSNGMVAYDTILDNEYASRRVIADSLAKVAGISQ